MTTDRILIHGSQREGWWWVCLDCDATGPSWGTRKAANQEANTHRQTSHPNRGPS